MSRSAARRFHRIRGSRSYGGETQRGDGEGHRTSDNSSAGADRARRLTQRRPGRGDVVDEQESAPGQRLDRAERARQVGASRLASEGLLAFRCAHSREHAGRPRRTRAAQHQRNGVVAAAAVRCPAARNRHQLYGTVRSFTRGRERRRQCAGEWADDVGAALLLHRHDHMPRCPLVPQGAGRVQGAELGYDDPGRELPPALTAQRPVGEPAPGAVHRHHDRPRVEEAREEHCWPGPEWEHTPSIRLPAPACVAPASAATSFCASVGGEDQRWVARNPTARRVSVHELPLRSRIVPPSPSARRPELPLPPTSAVAPGMRLSDVRSPPTW